MTRINLVPPQELSRQHLLAEYRELPRVFALARKAGASSRPLSAPQRYTLGPGHVKFFYNRPGWLVRRHSALVTEMLARGYSPAFTDVSGLAEGLSDEPWEPDEEEIAISRARIAERIGNVH